MNPRYSAAPAGKVVSVRHLGTENRADIEPMSALDAIQAVAWRDFILFAWSQPEARAQFERDTGVRISSAARWASPIEALVDQATGATADVIATLERFVEWATRYHFGLEHAPRAYQAHLREAQVARALKPKKIAARVCALCAADLPDDEPLRLRPEGKNGENVPVCVGCDDIHPRSGRYAFSDGATPDRNSLGEGNHRKARAR